MSYEDGMPAGGNSRFRGYPARMSERQQLALLLQMTSQETTGTSRSDNANTQSSRSSPLQHQRNTKTRWSNKNGETNVNLSSINRKDDRVRQMFVNGYNPASKDSNVTGSSSPDESSGSSPIPAAASADCASTVGAVSSAEQAQQQQHYQQQQSYYHYNQQSTAGSNPSVTFPSTEEGGVTCEMRRTPPQNKVERPGIGQSGNSPRVTLRLNQVRSTRDEKRGSNTTSNTHKVGLTSQIQSQMDVSSKTTIGASGAGAGCTNTTSTGGNNSSSDSGDVYEFKSSKEATPTRGSSNSPNPGSDKDSKESHSGATASGTTNAGASSGAAGSLSSGTTSETGTSSTSSVILEDSSVACSPSSKRSLEGDNTDDLDDESRRKKRKDIEPSKDNNKSNLAQRQTLNRNVPGVAEKCAKSGKQGVGTTSGKGGQNNGSTNSDRKSPSASLTANSPKPLGASAMASNLKSATLINPESDNEEDRLKNLDSGLAPKVPPLKIVIPQSTTSEQEQGNRNGKNQSNRNHQLPYVVASSNSNDSSDKDQSQSASGTTSPTENTTGIKTEDKKDFSGTLHNDDRSTHHQRVLRSAHRGGNGGNGVTNSKENSNNSSGNSNYSNSSPLPATLSVDRSNNSSPQQRHNSPTPESMTTEPGKQNVTDSPNPNTGTKTNPTSDKTEKVEIKKEVGEVPEVNIKKENTETSNLTSSGSVDLHPRKRKMKPSKEAQQITAAINESLETANAGPEIHPHDQPITNCYQLFLNIRKQIERRRKGLFPVQPKPPQGFKDYLMNRCTYVLAGNANKEPTINPPPNLPPAMKDLYIEQEKERYRLRMQHVVEKEKLVLSVEQEILRVHGRAARALANQSLPFSVCTILKDEEVYNVITPEQEEKDRNARSRYNGRLFLSWLQDVDDKWEKIKEAMLLRHHNEAESLHAVQKMDWEWKLKEVGLCEFKATPQIEDIHVPMVHVSDDFDLLPA